MQVSPISIPYKVNFGRRLSADEEHEMVSANSQAKRLLGNTGNSTLIVHDVCLPQNNTTNTGVASPHARKSLEFFEFAKKYFGINTVEYLPQGEFTKKHRSGLICAYSNSSLSLNESLIDLEALTSENWDEILKPEELESIVDENNLPTKETLVNFENIYGEKTEFQTGLKKAFKRFKNLDRDNLLAQEFSQYKVANDDYLMPKAIYNVLKGQNDGKDFDKWTNELDKALFDDESPFTKEQRNTRIKEILDNNAEEIEFYKFKQFVAEKHLAESRLELQKKGIKVIGDMPIGFAKDEIWTNPKAFLRNGYVSASDWKAPCLNYDDIINNSESAGAKLLKRKAGLMAQRYDGLRFDASWMYIRPNITAPEHEKHPDYGSKVLKIMEDEVQRVQGSEFSEENLIHEFKASHENFPLFEGGNINKEVRNRYIILESENLNSGWGNSDYCKRTFDKYILGIGDHTAKPLQTIAETENTQKATQVRALAKIFNDAEENLTNPVEFVRAKFADIMSSKHNFIFYMDAFGRTERFDSQAENGFENYRYKIPEDYLDSYHKAVQEGRGLNLSDALAKAFEKEGLDKKHPHLYKKLCKFAQILKEKEPTETSASQTKSAEKFPWKKLGIGGAIIVATGLAVGAIYKYNKQKESEK